MELSALLARGASEFISSARGETAQEDNQRFRNHRLGLGSKLVLEQLIVLLETFYVISSLQIGDSTTM